MLKFLFATTLTFFLILRRVSSECPDEPGWIPVGDFGCFLVSPLSLNFFAAQDFCWSHGGYLADIVTPEEEDLLDQFLNHDVAHWIGLTDLIIEGASR